MSMRTKPARSDALEGDSLRRSDEIEIACNQIGEAAMALNRAASGLHREIRTAQKALLPVPTITAETPTRPALLSIPEVIAWLGVSKGTLRTIRLHQNFPQPVRLSQRRILFYAKDVEQWLSTQRSDS